MPTFVAKNGFSLDPASFPDDPLRLALTSDAEIKFNLFNGGQWRFLDADGAILYAEDGLPMAGVLDRTVGFAAAPGDAKRLAVSDLALPAAALAAVFASKQIGDVLPILLAGDDLIVGSNARDVLFGGAGDDEIRPGGSVTAGLTQAQATAQSLLPDLIDGGDGDDLVVLDLSGAGFAAFGAVIEPSGADTIVKAGGTGAAIAYRLHDVERLKIIGSTNDNNIQGLSGDDVIDLSGSNGSGFVNAGGGADRITGGAKNDNLRGGDGDDRIVGLGGNDVLVGGEGDDELRGSGGNDTIFGQNGDDSLYGGDGVDDLRGGDGDDYAHGGGGADEITGGAGADLLIGGLGDDLVFGEGGDDRLRGGDGNDVIAGGVGADVLMGDGGADRFVLAPGHGVDRVLDFTPGADRLDLTQFALGPGADPLALLTPRSGGVLVDLGDDGFFLRGVEASALTAGDFLL